MNALSSDVALNSFKLSVGPADLSAELKKNFSFRLALRAAANNRRRQVLDQVSGFFKAAEEFVRANGFSNGLVVILDNLEKLSSGESVQSSAKEMFIENSDALRAPGVHVIYTLPASIVFSRLGPELGTRYTGEPLVLPMVKVASRDTGAPFPDGQLAMGQVLTRRLDISEVFDEREDLVATLVRNSGGYTRDLLRLAQYALQFCEALPVTEAAVHKAVAKLRRSYVNGYSTSYRDLLSYIADHRPEVIPEELKGRLEEVIAGHFALIYENDANWYGVHPLVSELLASKQAVAQSAGPPQRQRKRRHREPS